MVIRTSPRHSNVWVREELAALSRSQLLSMGFPNVAFLSTNVQEIWTERFDREGQQLWYVVTVTVNNPAMVRGSTQLYKGSYKERVEAVLQAFLNEHAPGTAVRVEITGQGDGTLNEFILIDDLISSGKASSSSPLVLTARRYDIPAALLHGRHLVGPSPALASLVRDSMTRNEPPKSLLELFGGTGVASKVACRESAAVRCTLVEGDAAKLPFLKNHLDDARVSIVHSDVFAYRIDASFDLIVADPFYEHTVAFLETLGAAIALNCRRFVLASGFLEDLAWNSQVEGLLRTIGFVVSRSPKFGQMVFDCTPR